MHTGKKAEIAPEGFRLYYAPGACSLAANIILAEAGRPYSLERVDLKTHKTAAGEDFYKINPRGGVPALEVRPGVILTQNYAILTFIGDHSDVEAFRPAQGSLKRGRLDEALGFCSDLHGGAFSRVFRSWDEASKQKGLEAVHRRLAELEGWLSTDRPYWLGEDFTQADAYAAVILSWAPKVGVALEKFPKCQALQKRVFARSAAQKAVAQEEGG